MTNFWVKASMITYAVWGIPLLGILSVLLVLRRREKHGQNR